MKNVFYLPQQIKLAKKISSSYFYLLMKEPYRYYANKALNLKSKNRFKNNLQMVDFGLFLHGILENYTKTYSYPMSIHESEARFIKIAEKLMSRISSKQNVLWMHKVRAVAKEFIIFDERRRKEAVYTFAEEYGVTRINLCEKFSISVSSIVDRLELLKDGRLAIVDYKTGSIPSVKDVQQGIVPQLIVSAVIAQHSGFSCLKKINFSMSANCFPLSLSYVKLCSSSPYWRTTNTSLDLLALKKHFTGLKALLSFFYKEKDKPLFFLPFGGTSLYEDEYRHLSRCL
ncbi:PD-(D/E)XK nuclease family protein [Candidatus Sneabacter namystus]|uniref:PD-(D/E)XK endonuclease-like domain-containing protein n=1 Tax=Candidatus Sneabacter namystus TaxID=2601646 RepID=A0A5C0UIV6_9RICK|nr:PD-(D/E)XK nuclease family protein [Candidatus Sneabacter namystus]QEK39443.1 hypothetical protein FZC37_00610 [Candidatus Sneabacter namystus]